MSSAEKQSRLGPEWVLQQIELPQALYTITELSVLSGIEPSRIIHYLQGKGIIQKVKPGKKYQIAQDDLLEHAPEFWRTIERRVAKMAKS
jgi:hypothetical protein